MCGATETPPNPSFSCKEERGQGETELREAEKAACENAGRPAAISAPCQHPLTAAAVCFCDASA